MIWKVCLSIAEMYDMQELPDVPLFVNLHNLCSTLKCTAPSAVMFRSAVTNAGYRISGSHTTPLGFKTDAPMSVIWDIMRCWVVHLFLLPSLFAPLDKQRLISSYSIFSWTFPSLSYEDSCISKPQLMSNLELLDVVRDKYFCLMWLCWDAGEASSSESSAARSIWINDPLQRTNFPSLFRDSTHSWIMLSLFYTLSDLFILSSIYVPFVSLCTHRHIVWNT